MGWIIALLVVFVLYKFNDNGKKRWKLAIARITSVTFPDIIVDSVRPVLSFTKCRVGYSAELFLMYMSRYIVSEAKGLQSDAATDRDVTNVLCIIHGDENLKHILYEKYCEYAVTLPREYVRGQMASFYEFSNALAAMRYKNLP